MLVVLLNAPFAVVFHITTLMPCHSHDPNFIEKKKHIGNDYVTIVYDDSGENYRMGIIKVSQINQCLTLILICEFS